MSASPRDDEGVPAAAFPEVTFAFQPIVDMVERRVVSWEALLRGLRGESAAQVLGRIPTALLHAFDESLRPRAITLACGLGVDCDLNLNFLPQSIFSSPTALSSTVEAARSEGLDPGRLVLEISETEVIQDQARFTEQVNEYRGIGLRVAIDDFGAGHSGLNLLADFQPDQVKLDMKLVRNIQTHGPRQAIVRGVCQTCSDLAIDVVAEGVETLEEYNWLRGEGIQFFQGFLLTRPGIACLPAVRFP